MSPSASLPLVWRRPIIPEFDKALAKRDRIRARHHDSHRPQPRVNVDNTDCTRSFLDHDVGQTDWRKAGRIINLGIQFEAGPVSVGYFTEVGKGDRYALHEITGVFRVERAPVFHPVIHDADGQLAIHRSQKPELGHSAPRYSKPLPLGTFEGERKSACHGYDEAYGPVQMILSAMVVSLSVIGGLLIAYGMRAI